MNQDSCPSVENTYSTKELEEKLRNIESEIEFLQLRKQQIEYILKNRISE